MEKRRLTSKQFLVAQAGDGWRDGLVGWLVGWLVVSFGVGLVMVD